MHRLDPKHWVVFVVNKLCPEDLNSVMAKVLDNSLEVNEFELHSRHYVHSRTNAYVVGMNPFISPPIYV